MSNATRAILLFANFLVALAAMVWIVSSVFGYSFGRTLFVMLGIYVTVLLSYACYRRLAQKHRMAKSVRTQEPAEGGN